MNDIEINNVLKLTADFGGTRFVVSSSCPPAVPFILDFRGGGDDLGRALAWVVLLVDALDPIVQCVILPKHPFLK